jgi:hypothetical protein
MPRLTPGSIRVDVRTGPEWKRVADTLAAQNAMLGDRFRSELRDAADELARRAQANVMQIPVHTGQHSGLRARVARGVGTKITKSGVQITTSMNEQDEINLPAYLDSQSGWRHPVYGNRHVWVRQMTGGSWFRATIEHGQPMIQDRLEEVFENAARAIARAG